MCTHLFYHGVMRCTLSLHGRPCCRGCGGKGPTLRWQSPCMCLLFVVVVSHIIMLIAQKISPWSQARGTLTAKLEKTKETNRRKKKTKKHQLSYCTTSHIVGVRVCTRGARTVPAFQLLFITLGTHICRLPSPILTCFLAGPNG